MFLRQSTAQAISFGPFLDSTDGVTAETGLTIAQSDMQLSKDGGAYAQKSAAGNATHDADGHYTTTLSTTDTATVGILKLQVTVSGALPVFERFYVVEEAIYDGVYASGASAPSTHSAADVWSAVTRTLTASTNFNDISTSDVDARLAAIGLDHLLGTSVTGTDVANNSIFARLVSASATADWDDFVNTTDSLQGIRDRGDSAWITATTVDLNADQSGVTVGTVTTLTGHTAQTGDSFARLGAPAGASVSADIATIDGNVDAILLDTGTDGVVLAGTPDVNMAQISGDATAADKLEEGATALVLLTVNDASATTTSFVTSSTEATDDHYNGRIITFTTGNLAGQATDITDYNGTTKAVTVTALTEAPGNGDAFVIS